jgi:hypothetical protein
MLERLKVDLDNILALVKKCPAELQETALKTILEHWFRSNVEPACSTQRTSPSSREALQGAGQADLPQVVRTFMVANATADSELGKVFHPLGPGVQLVSSDLPGQGKGGKQMNLALLLSVRQAITGGGFGCPLEELRQMCLHYDCYDVPNFAANLKRNSQLFKPRKKGEDIELSAAGMKRAAGVIKQIAGGSSGA